MYAVRFLDNGTDQLYGTYGTFRTVEAATWWARHESDGKSFTVHNLGD